MEDNNPKWEDTEELAPSWDETEEVASTKQEVGISPLMAGATTSASLGATGAAVEKGLSSLASKLGPFSSENLETILGDYDRYKKIDTQEVAKQLEGQFRGINRNINELHREAFANLQGNLPREKYLDILQESAIPFGRDIDPLEVEKLRQQEIQSKIQNTTAKLNADLENKIQKSLDNQLTDQAKEIQQARNVGQYSIKTAKEQADELNQIKEEIRNTVKLNRAKAESEAIGSLQDALKSTKPISLDEQSILKKLSTPLTQEFPKFSGKKFVPQEENIIKSMASMFPEGTVPMTGEEVYETVQKFRGTEPAGFNPITTPLRKKVTENLREFVAQSSPEASELLKKESEQIKKLEKLEKSKYLKRDKTVSKLLDEFVQVGDPQLKNIYSDILGSKQQLTDDVVQRLSTLKEILPEEMYKNVELSALKSLAEKPSSISKIGAMDIIAPTVAGSAAGPVAAAKAATANVGSKMLRSPEGAIQTARAAKFLGGAAKTAAPILGGLVTAGLTASQYSDLKKQGKSTGDIVGEIATDIINPVGTKNMEALAETLRKAKEQNLSVNVNQLNNNAPKNFREMQEQNLKAADRYSNKAVITDSDVNSLSEAKAIANSDDKYRAFADLLEQFDEMTKDQQDKAMFAMQQQPAFRQMTRKNQDKVK